MDTASLSERAGDTLVAAAGADVWESVSNRFARLFGRGQPDPQIERLLAATHEQLATAASEDLRQAQAAEWTTRFKDLLVKHRDAETELAALVKDVRKSFNWRAKGRKHATTIFLLIAAVVIGFVGYELRPPGAAADPALTFYQMTIKTTPLTHDLMVGVETIPGVNGDAFTQIYLATPSPRRDIKWRITLLVNSEAVPIAGKPSTTTHRSHRASHGGAQEVLDAHENILRRLALPGNEVSLTQLSLTQLVVTGTGITHTQLPPPCLASSSDSSDALPPPGAALFPDAYFLWPQAGPVSANSEYVNALILGAAGSYGQEITTLRRSLCPNTNDLIIDSGRLPNQAPAPLYGYSDSFVWIDKVPAATFIDPAPAAGVPFLIRAHSIGGTENANQNGFYSGILLGVAVAVFVAALQTTIDQWSKKRRRNPSGLPRSSNGRNYRMFLVLQVQRYWRRHSRGTDQRSRTGPEGS
jgi:hypothetical protein